VNCGWVKCSEGLSNRVSNIIRKYIDHMKFTAYMVFLCITFFYVLLVTYFYHCILVVCVCMLLFNCLNYVFYCYVYVLLLLCM
jgi:hypothetical protein